jgi:osmoprotectant transport system permease protein
VDILTLTQQWFADPGVWSGPGGIPARLVQHVLLTAGVVLTASVIALPVGVWLGHRRRGDALTVALVGAARAVPTLGLLTLLGLMIGIGIGAPFITLVVLAAPPLLAAASAGIRAVDATTIDAAYAMGMSTRAVVLTVELPLAATVILGGARSAVLQVIATATLAAYTSDTGLGRYIFTGLKSREYGEMVGGAIVVVALALVVDAVIAAANRRLTTRRPARPRPTVSDSAPPEPPAAPTAPGATP